MEEEKIEQKEELENGQLHSGEQVQAEEEEIEQESALEEIYEEFAITEAIMDGSNLVEEFSPHGTAERVAQYTHVSEKVINYVMAAVYFALGVFCIVVSIVKYDIILAVLSYMVGAFMALIGLLQLISAIKRKEYRHTNTNKTAGSLVLIALAVMILIDHEWSMSIIPIIWGVIGLFEGAHAFNHAFARISDGRRCSYYIVKGIIELVLAFLLLYEPVHHLKLHIIVFGVNLVFDAITMLPIVKKFTEGK